MLKMVFIGSQNSFDEVLVHWLAQRTQLVGVVWTKSTAWQSSWLGLLKFARKRFKRYGLLKLVDEAFFYTYYHAFIESHDLADIDEQIVQPYWAKHGNIRWNGDSLFSQNVNSLHVQNFLLERQPDIALAMCISNYFSGELRQIPRLGVYLWHEGITPEYKGLYSPFWAVHNCDFEHLGYTLLRMSDELDAGEIFVQGSVQNIDPLKHNHGFIGHKAIFDSLPAVEHFLAELESGSARPMFRQSAESNYYTYPGFTDLVRQRIRLRRHYQEKQTIQVTNN